MKKRTKEELDYLCLLHLAIGRVFGKQDWAKDLTPLQVATELQALIKGKDGEIKRYKDLYEQLLHQCDGCETLKEKP